MKLRTMPFLLAVTFAAMSGYAQGAPENPSYSQFVGIWHADVDGQPTGTLTLATDTGELGGTVVLDIVSDRSGTPRVIASEPHVLMNLHISGNTLSFQVKMKRPDGTIVLPTFTVTLTSPAKAAIHCVTCSANAPVVELTKGQ